MEFKVLHRSAKRMRIRVPIKCTLDVQEYLLDIAETLDTIQHIHFYNDLHVFAVTYDIGCQRDVLHLLNQIDLAIIREKYEHPILRAQETPYSIVSNALVKRFLFTTLLPQPFQILRTAFLSFSYIRYALSSLFKRELTMETLDGTAIAVSMLTKQFDMASSIMFILELGERLTDWTQKKSVEDLEKSLEAKTKDVWILKDDKRLKVSCLAVQLHDTVIVEEGHEILFDGTVLEGRGAVNESSITGESFPLIKSAGDSVYSNTVLESGELFVKVENTQANARIHQLIELMKETDSLSESKQYQFINAADHLVKYNFIGALLTYLLTRSFSKAISFLLVDYSCSLKLSTPVVYLSAIQQLLNHGIVVKSPSTLDIYKEIDSFVFDKTGTITNSHPQICEIVTFYDYSEEEVLRIGACLEEHIYHPLAQAVVDKAEDEGIEHPEMHAELYHIASKGIVSSIAEDKVVIGNYALLEDEGIYVSDLQKEIIAEHEKQYNLLYLGYKGQLIAIFCIDIILRTEAAAVLSQLKETGKRLVLLTGDTKERTEKTVANLPFDQVLTNQVPATKHAYILSEKAAGRRVLMVGDGLNDSAALSASDISVSMGDGADLSKQVSDVLFLSDSLQSLLELEAMTDQVARRVQLNITTAVTINTSLICCGLFNLMPSKTLALLHNLTTFGVVLTSFTVKSTK